MCRKCFDESGRKIEDAKENYINFIVNEINGLPTTEYTMLVNLKK